MAAAPREFALVSAHQVSALAAGAQLIVVRHLVEVTLASNGHRVLTAAAPWMVAFVLLALFVSIATAVQTEWQRVLGI